MEGAAMTELPEIKSLIIPTDMSRRGFMVTSLATGFALAAGPVQAAAIMTDTKGLTAGEVKIPVKDGHIPGYRAMPAAGGPFPTVLVIHEIFGVHEHIKDICRRLAKVGYFAVAPELYARQGDASKYKMSEVPKLFAEIVMKTPDPEVMSDLDATAAWAKTTGSADTARMAVTGFCWGGRATLLYAAHNPNLKAAVAWYGHVMRKMAPQGAMVPFEQVSKMRVPLLGLYGAEDKGIPPADVKKLEAALKAQGTKCEFVIYPGAGHAFNADYRPSYREGPAKDGWKRMLAWFKANGVA
jgi:carboxymethylenebutenolidase